MNDSNRKELVSLLMTLDLNEIHPTADCAVERHDKAEALYLLKVERCIDTLLKYLGR